MRHVLSPLAVMTFVPCGLKLTCVAWARALFAQHYLADLSVVPFKPMEHLQTVRNGTCRLRDLGRQGVVQARRAVGAGAHQHRARGVEADVQNLVVVSVWQECAVVLLLRQAQAERERERRKQEWTQGVDAFA
jgi:hypothetical protein